MVADFRRRFWVSLVLTAPVLALAPVIQHWLGLRDLLHFPGDSLIAFGLATVIFFYGGRPFLTGFFDELRKRQPGMMTLISVAITVAYVYSAAVVFGLRGAVFFWELATLIDIMLLGHWIEMRSVMGASAALESLARLMPSLAHRLRPGGGSDDVPISELKPGDRVLVRPGEKVPTDPESAGGPQASVRFPQAEALSPWFRSRTCPCVPSRPRPSGSPRWRHRQRPGSSGRRWGCRVVPRGGGWGHPVIREVRGRGGSENVLRCWPIAWYEEGTSSLSSPL
jgi:hypothetical protein